MKTRLVKLLLLATFALLSAIARADLTSETYVKARSEYRAGNCYNAVPLLRKYLAEDGDFLRFHRDYVAAISAAIDYCERPWPSPPPPPPKKYSINGMGIGPSNPLEPEPPPPPPPPPRPSVPPALP